MTTRKELEKAREKLRKDTEQYLKTGGKIEELPYGVVKDEKKELTFNR